MLRLKDIMLEILGKKPLEEWSIINSPDDILPSPKYKIYVFGDDRSLMTPHFHFFDIDNTFSLEIQIKNIDELKILISKIKRKGVDKNKLLTWEGLSKERKILSIWLDKTNSHFKEYKNSEFIAKLWDLNNPNNKIK